MFQIPSFFNATIGLIQSFIILALLKQKLLPFGTKASGVSHPG